MPEPVGTCAAAGTCALEKVMVWPSRFRVEPSWIRLDVVVAEVVRAAPTVTLQQPTDVGSVRPFNAPALPVMLRSAPVVVARVSTPPADIVAVEPVMVAAPA